MRRQLVAPPIARQGGFAGCVGGSGTVPANGGSSDNLVAGLKKYLAETGPRTRDSAESHGEPEEARSASDKGHPDAEEPSYLARNHLRHDGLLDITGGSDLVTVSWSRFADHDKAMLIGNSDSATGDRGKLRVTDGYPVDLLAVYNAYDSGSERDLTGDVGWTPTLHTKIDSAERADREVAYGAGAGRIP